VFRITRRLYPPFYASPLDPATHPTRSDAHLPPYFLRCSSSTAPHQFPSLEVLGSTKKHSPFLPFPPSYLRSERTRVIHVRRDLGLPALLVVAPSRRRRAIDDTCPSQTVCADCPPFPFTRLRMTNPAIAFAEDQVLSSYAFSFLPLFSRGHNSVLLCSAPF